MKPASIRLALTLAALALVLPSAGKPGGKAAKKLAGSVNSAVKAYKSDLKDAYKLIGLQLSLIEQNVQVFGWSIQTRDDLFTAARDFQQAMRNAAEIAVEAVAAGGQSALAGFAGSGALDGKFPAGFAPGDGGKLDDFRARLGKLDATQYARVAKRFAKTRKLAEKKAGVSLGLVLLPVLPVPAFVFDEDTHQVEAPRSGLDTLVAVGRVDTDGDGVLFVAGNGQSGQDVTVTATPLSGGGVLSLAATPGDGAGHRWNRLVDDGGSGLSEGTWRVSAARTGETEVETRVIGVR